MRRLIVLFCIICGSRLVWAQNVSQSLLESLTEMTLENSEEEPDIDELLDRWQFFLQNPIPVNSDCTDELRQLGFLSEFQIQAIVNYKRNNGAILSIYELDNLDNFDRELLEKLQPFLSFEGTRRKPYNQRSRRELLLRSQRVVEQSKAYREKAYIGSPEKYYLRFKQTGSTINFGMVAEKDAGEAFFRKPNQTGFDYYSGFANCSLKDGKYRFYVGDFLVRAGQGLTVWQGFSSGKSAEVSQVFKTGSGLRSYSSADENRFFRGAAGVWSFKKGTLILFGSAKKIDGNLEETEDETVFTSFQTSGLHRTDGEIADKHSVAEKVGGGIFTYRKKNFEVGITGIHTCFDKRKVTNGHLYQKYLFTGKQLSNVGASYKWSWTKVFLFGELATSFNGGWAGIQGAMLKPADPFELSVLYRNFNQRYASLYGQAFAESSSVNDEQGLYVGVKYWPVSKVSVSAYRDFFQHQWLKYKTVAPAQGSETFFQLNYAPTETMNIYFRYFREEKEEKSSVNQMDVDQERILKKFRFNFDLELNEQWATRSRGEFVFFQEEAGTEHGLLLLHTLKYKALSFPFSCQLSIAFFDAESYDCRLYAYENDLLYTFSFPALYGNGIRCYWNTKYSLSSRMDLWFKVAQTKYFRQESIGSGWDKISGDRKTEIKFQLRYRF